MSTGTTQQEEPSESSAATSLDAAVFLGLAGKAEEVFSRPDHFLSFPLSLWGMDPDELSAAVNDPLSAEGVRGEADFADLVNSIPTGALWQPRPHTRLWDVHGDVLRAVLAEGTRTPKEEAAYQEALDVLKVEEDGALVDSPAVVEYERCRDAYIAAVQEFNNRQNQAELSQDPAVTDAWAEDRPKLQQAVDAAAEAWDLEGQRGLIDKARATFRDIGSRSPAQLWEDYRKQFDPDLEEIFFKAGPQGVRYVPTGYIPADVVDSAWSSMSLTRNDLAALAEQAPAELRDRLAAQALDEGVVSLTLEYSTVTPHRSWFDRAPYTSRAWRFPESDRLLSDGQSPPEGECPAYVTGVVLVRNLALERREPAPEPEPEPERPARPRTSTRARRGDTARPRRRSRRTRSADSRGSSGVTGVIRQAAARVRKVATTKRTAKVRDHRERPSTSRTRRRSDRPVTRVPSRRGSVARPTPAPPTSVRIGGDEIYVLAFECWTLPRCPNPDLGLVW